MAQGKMDEDRRGMLVGGLITLGIGAIFLLSNLGIIPSMRDMWPLFPIIIGIALIIGALVKGKRPEQPDQPEQ